MTCLSPRKIKNTIIINNAVLRCSRWNLLIIICYLYRFCYFKNVGKIKKTFKKEKKVNSKTVKSFYAFYIYAASVLHGMLYVILFYTVGFSRRTELIIL